MAEARVVRAARGRALSRRRRSSRSARSSERDAVAVVGHEPHLSELVSLLLAGDADAVALDLKKGAVVRLDLTGDAAVLRWVATPKMLRLLSPR